MTTLLAILAFALILVTAWGGMRLMQRTTGCACPTPEHATDRP